ncbi:hypothetical protein V7O61_04495 [Methanolobus sp. WCC1]|uniref:hypothetical protein n=1 Tax=unclassified Methanolobus TaxID=2629569 RepID=UPI0032467281
MTVLSILSCKILQDELVWLLGNDAEIDNVLIVDNGNISEFTEKLDEQRTTYEIVAFEKMPGILEDADEGKLTVVVNIRELALHMVPKKLKSEVYQCIE